MPKVFVVMGSTGEYSDRIEWPVKAFRSEKTAQELVIKASEQAREVKRRRDLDEDDPLYIDRYRVYLEENFEFPNEFDPQMQMDYNGTYYFIYEVELEEPL